MTKQELLDYLSKANGAAADQVASDLGLNYSAASMALLRANRQGLVERLLDPDSGLYWYQLSIRGRERLNYFHS